MFLRLFSKRVSPPQLGRWALQSQDVSRKIDFANYDNCCCGEKKVYVDRKEKLERKKTRVNPTKPDRGDV
tara:strand:- start:7 stop:216 length:210 start_codon:yes stop_codon:yes gene_type:complete